MRFGDCPSSSSRFSARAGGIVCRECAAASASIGLKLEGVAGLEGLLRRPLADAGQVALSARGARDIPRCDRRRPTNTTAAFGSGRFRRERSAEHSEVGRSLVQEEFDVEAVADGAVKHEHLPPAVRLRNGDEVRVDVEEISEPVLPDEPRRSSRRRRPRRRRSRMDRAGRARGRGRHSRSAQTRFPEARRLSRRRLALRRRERDPGRSRAGETSTTSGVRVARPPMYQSGISAPRSMGMEASACLLPP